MELINVINEIAAQVESGNTSPLRAFITLKQVEDALKKAMDKLKDEAVSEAESYNQKSFDLMGAKVELRSGASQWKFEGVTSVNEYAEKLKVYQELSKTAAKSKEPIYDSEGVQIEPAQQVFGRATIAVSLINK